MSNLHGWDFPPHELSNNYIKKCRLFVENDTLFEHFRRDEDYTKILEGGGYAHGQLYLNKIKRLFGLSAIQEYLEKFKENDIYGNPFVFEYGDLGTINNHTIMYIAHALSIRELLGERYPKRILEIGGGYGGMCKTFSVLYNFDEYILVDLPDAIDLAKKYLKHFPEIYEKVTFIKCNELSGISPVKDLDLFIAVFSLSECNEETQMLYTDKFLLNSQYGFIGYNKLHIPEVKSIYHKWIDKILLNFHLHFDRSIPDALYIDLKKKD